MRVSVVIPTYNSAPLVVEAVRSVLAQTRPAAEVLVVDDGSTDDTADRLAGFGSPVRVIRKENGGVSSARNRGVAEATGDLIAFLDADDVWHPRKLEVQLGVLDRHPDLGMLGTGVFDWPGPVPELSGSPPSPTRVPIDHLIVRNQFCTSTIVVRTPVTRAAGEFDTSLQGPEDYDLWLRIAAIAATANLDTALTGYRHATPSSLSKNAERMERDTLRILGKMDTAGLFRGRELLRRRALGSTALTAAYVYFDARRYAAALRRIAESFWWWPLPFARSEVNAFLARPRFAVGVLRRWAFCPQGR